MNFATIFGTAIVMSLVNAQAGYYSFEDGNGVEQNYSETEESQYQPQQDLVNWNPHRVSQVDRQGLAGLFSNLGASGVTAVGAMSVALLGAVAISYTDAVQKSTNNANDISTLRTDLTNLKNTLSALSTSSSSTRTCANNVATQFNQLNTALVTPAGAAPTTVAEVLAALVALTDATGCP